MGFETFRSRTQTAHVRPPQDNLLTVETSGTSFRFKNPDGTPASDWIDAKGDPGAAGADGNNSGVTVTSETAGATIGAGDVVGKRSDGKVYRVDYTTTTYPYTVLGLAQAAAVLDDPVTIQTEGEMQDASWSFTAYEPVFAGAAGVVSQRAALTMQAGRALIPVGWAIAADRILITLSEPEVWV